MKFQLTFVLMMSLECSSTSPKRSKRIVNGDVWKGRPSTYNVIQYYGGIASAHATWYTFGKVFDFLKNAGHYGQFYCSGSLLTPAIFQTACHCVASFDVSHKGIIKPPLVNHQWEGKKVVYLGVSNRFGEDSMVTTNYVLTEKFLIDDRCADVGGSHAITYDYALIQINSDFLHYETYRYKWLEIRYAPQYTIEDISDFHHYALKNQLVCLMLGFGVFDDSPEREGNYYPSDVLRHGWNALQNQHDCAKGTQFIVYDKKVVRLDPEHVNWVCTESFPEHNAYTYKGDSGSPLSCDNRYFGILSGIRYFEGKDGIKHSVKNAYHPLIYSLFTNSVNYRYKLLYVIYRLQEKYEITGQLYLPPGGRAGGKDSSELTSVKSRDPKFPVQTSFQFTSRGLQLRPNRLALPFVVHGAFDILNKIK